MKCIIYLHIVCMFPMVAFNSPSLLICLYTVEMIVHLDANPTSLTFGGEDLDELFITTRAPNGGGLYRLKMPFGVKGIPEPEFTLGSSGSSYGIGGGKKPADSSMGSYLSSL